MTDALSLAGSVAVVTGASGGIGGATARLLAQRGAAVVVHYFTRADAAAAVVEAIRADGGRAVAAGADVRDLDAVKALAAEANAAFGPVDILVNNAGIARDNLLLFLSDAEWDAVLDTDLRGPFHTMKVFGRDMTRRRAGAIVNVASDAGLLGDTMRSHYAAAKAGLLGLSRSAAREFAGTGVRVNAVAPGLVDTAMTADLREQRRAAMLERIPMARFGRPEEVAGVIAFLASPAAAYLTGESICIDGGLRM